MQNTFKKILSLFLAVVMCLSMVPYAAFAEEEGPEQAENVQCEEAQTPAADEQKEDNEPIAEVEENSAEAEESSTPAEEETPTENETPTLVEGTENTEVAEPQQEELPEPAGEAAEEDAAPAEDITPVEAAMEEETAPAEEESPEAGQPDEADVALTEEQSTETAEEDDALSKDASVIARENQIHDEFVYINPAYSGVISEEDLLPRDSASKGSLVSKETYLSDSEAAGQLRNLMKQRVEDVVIYYVTKDYNENSIKNLYGVACYHNGTPNEGDYLSFSALGYHCGLSGYSEDGYYYLTLEFTFSYTDTYAEEQQAQSAASSILASLSLDGKSSYEKAKAIYDYLTENVTYDYSLNNHAGYHALVEHHAVCQGIALAYYRLALSAGLDARIVSSEALNHAWNIVQVGGAYYYLDATWDLGNYQNYLYFLKDRTSWVVGSIIKQPHDYGDEFDINIDGKLSSYYVPDADYSEPAGGGNPSGSCGLHLTWELDEDGTLTISGTGAMDACGGPYASDAVAPWNEYKDQIIKIIIEDDVTSVGDAAFTSCSNLETVELPSGLSYIGIAAFAECQGLADINLPSGLTGIGFDAFGGCSSLESIALPEGLTYVPSDCFSGCSGLTDIQFPSNIEEIREYAFSGCTGLSSIVFTGDAPVFGDYCFENVEATAYYPAGAEGWTENVLQDYGGSITWVMNGNPSGSCGQHLTWEMDEDGTLTVSGTGAMSNWDGETAPAPWAGYAESILAVVVENGVTSIGNSAFYGCEQIKSISIPGSVAAIGSYAFSGCSSLQSVTIPSGVTIIEEATFGGCSSLASVAIPATVTEIRDSAFYYCSSLAEITIPSSVTKIGNSAFRSCSSLEEIIIPSGVTYIAPYAFHGCSGMTYAEINANISILEFSAFNSCRSLQKVVLPSGLITVSDYAFDGCRSLTEITLPDSLLYVGVYAFRACSALEEIIIPAKTSEIRDYAFAKCSKLKEIILPDSVKKIGIDAFDGCKALTTAVLPENKIFTIIEDRVFSSCSALTEIIIPSTVTTIDIAAFMGCSSLTSVTIPKKVTKINDAAFNGCTGLEKIIFEGIAPTIGSYVFYNVTANAYYPCTNTTWKSSKLQQYEGMLTWDKWHTVVAHDAKAVTCTEAGWEAYETCSKCKYSTYAEIPALGHNLVHHDAQVPTCTEVGWDAYDTCSRCDYSTYKELPEAHDLVHHDAQATTCTEIGWKAYDTCRLCDYSTYEEIPALGHDFTHYEAKAPACEEVGWEAYDTCSRCDYSNYEEIPALGHDIEHHGAQEPTATEAGWEAYDTCTRCSYSTYKATYAVIYELNGGTNSDDNPDKYIYGEVLKFAAPTRLGYSFAGWYKDSALKTKILQINKGTKGTVTVYAKWTPLPKYKITYKNLPTYAKGSLGVLDNSMNPTTFTADTKPEQLYEPTVPGYTFGGWFTDSKLTNPVTESFWTSAAKTVYAKLTPIPYSISYDLAGGTAPAKGNKTEYTVKTAVTLNSPTKSGYTFAGWYLDDTKLTKLAANTWYGGDLALVARWTPNSYTLVLNGNGGTVSGQTKITGLNTESIAELPGAVRASCTFEGWATKNNGTGDFYPAGSVNIPAAKNKSTVTLYAVWSYELSFDGNGSESGTMAPQTFICNQSTPLNAGTFTKAGYYLAGWNTDLTKAQKGAIQYKDGASVKNLAGKTLYAVWKPCTYTIKFDANGGTGKMSNLAMTYSKAKALTANAFKNPGHTFLGWSTDPAAMEAAFTNKAKIKDELIPESNKQIITLYAVWD